MVPSSPRAAVTGGRPLASPRDRGLCAVAADALRRGLLAVAALVASLAAHVAGGQGIAFLRIAPLVWLSLIGASIVVGRFRTTFRPRGPVAVIGSLALAQALLHVGFTYAPWAFGLEAHHLGPLVTAPAVIAHLAAVVVLGLLLVRVERLLGACVRVVAAVRALLASPRRRRRAPDLAIRRPVTARIALRSRTGRARAIRGPPLLSAPAVC